MNYQQHPVPSTSTSIDNTNYPVPSTSTAATVSSDPFYLSLNEITKTREIKGLRELPVNVKFAIKKIYKFNTKFGDQIRVEFEEFDTFLGTRFVKNLTSNDLEELQMRANKNCLFLIVTGTKGKAVDVKFC